MALYRMGMTKVIVRRFTETFRAIIGLYIKYFKISFFISSFRQQYYELFTQCFILFTWKDVHRK